MNQPNFEELDVLMGESPKSRQAGRKEADVLDVEPQRGGRRSGAGIADSLGLPGGEGSKAALVKKVILLSILVIGLVATALMAWYLWRELGPRDRIATPDLVSETLGGAPNVAAATPATEDAVVQVPPDAVLPAQAPSAEAAAAVAPPPVAGAEVAAVLDPSPAPTVVPPEAPPPLTTASGDAVQAELAALKTERDGLAKELERAKADLDRSKREAERARRELAEARRRQPDVLVRDSRTTVTLTEVLSDGAVMRDRTGNEVIVPRGATFEVVGDRVATGVRR